ncbi:hypothetical protein D9758_004431 [Tetrapyrgos nigripes]|uniref:Uncharacterized protein n=1 Tax=Tetrapyrgos nigripes TaxID=182062 RepID=A0A8H5LSN2_9AGAR|nr:hypothetical protein D9758_004431 [Tetrapyrgos nigripes]
MSQTQDEQYVNFDTSEAISTGLPAAAYDHFHAIPILPHLLPSPPLPPLPMPLYLSEALQSKTLTFTFDGCTESIPNLHEFLCSWPPSRLGAGGKNNDGTYRTMNTVDVEWIAVNTGQSPWPTCGSGNTSFLGSPSHHQIPNQNRRETISSILHSSIPVATLGSLQNSFDHLVSSHRVDGAITLTVSALDTLALSHGITSGKWFMFVDEDNVDRVWTGVVEIICLKLGAAAKGVFARVGKNRENRQSQPFQRHDRPVTVNQEYLIYIYVPDFSNVSLVFSIRQALRDLGAELGYRGLTKKIAFKMDLYSVLGIYSRNQWRISVNRWYE